MDNWSATTGSLGDIVLGLVPVYEIKSRYIECLNIHGTHVTANNSTATN